MAKRQILLVGLDPVTIDFSKGPHPELTAQVLQDGLDQAKLSIEADGDKEVTYGFLDAQDMTFESSVERTKQQLTGSAKTWSLMIIGAGVRTDPNYMLLFEKVINIFLEFAPGVRVCFNTYPTTTEEAVRRWIDTAFTPEVPAAIIAESSFEKQILLVGLDPVTIDFAKGPHPELTAEVLQNGLDQQKAEIEEDGYKVTYCFLDAQDMTFKSSIERLRQQLIGVGKAWSLVVIGAGVRTDSNYLLLFEIVINIVHEFAPGLRICFNTYPTDTKDAIERWIHYE